MITDFHEFHEQSFKHCLGSLAGIMDFLVLMVYWQHIIAEMVMYTTHMAILCLMGFL